MPIRFLVRPCLYFLINNKAHMTMKTGKQIGQTFPGTARFSADGQRLLTWADDGAARVWDILAAAE